MRSDVSAHSRRGPVDGETGPQAALLNIRTWMTELVRRLPRVPCGVLVGCPAAYVLAADQLAVVVEQRHSAAKE
ncbi:hypothetical protein SMICM304S_05355 [Streptomyces microflavus]